ncbi:MAG: tetratricopeptide repeat protein [Polyangiales bacterium]
MAFVLAILPGAMIACGGSKPAASPTGAPSASTTSSAVADDTTPEPTATAAPVATAAPIPTTAPPAPTPAPEPASKLSGSARDAYDRGVAAYSKGDLAGAVAALQQAVAAEPRAYEAHYALGMALEHLGKLSDALEEYRNASKIKPDYAKAVAAYCFLLYRQGSKTEAESKLGDAQAASPKDVHLMTALAEIKSLQGDSATAQQLASAALTADAKYEAAMVMIARDYFRTGRVDLASYVLGAVLDGQQTEEERSKGLPAKKNPPRAPNNAEAHFLRALIFQRLGDRLHAAQWLESAAKLRPDLVDAQLALGMIRLEANDADGALAPLKLAVAFNPQSVEGHIALGEANRLTSHPAEAKAEYLWVTSSSLSSPQQKALAQYDMGLLYFLTPNFEGLVDTNRLDKAIDLFTQFNKAKGSASGPSWPADADDLIEQARRAKTVAAASASGGGSTKAKSPEAAKAPPAAASVAPVTAPAASAKPAAAASVAPSAASAKPAASASAKPATSSSAAPSTSAKPAASASAAPSASAKPAASASAKPH